MTEKENDKITFSFTIEELQLIIGGLGKLPFEKVYQLIGRLNEEANDQLTEKNNEQLNN